MSIRLVPVRVPDDLQVAEEEFASNQRPDGVFVGLDPVLYASRATVIGLVSRLRIPALYAFIEAVREGGLIAYSPDFVAISHRAASYVDKILAGADPAELPVEQPTKFTLAVNSKTSSQLGLTIPPSLLAQADEVIE